MSPRTDLNEPRPRPWAPDLVDAMDDVLKAHAHDQVLRLREQNLIDGCLQPAEKLPFVLKQVFRRPELRPWRHHVRGVNPDPVEAILPALWPMMLQSSCSVLVLVAGMSSPNFLPEAAYVWIAARRVYATESLDRLAVVNDPGSRERRHGRRVRVRNNDFLPR